VKLKTGIKPHMSEEIVILKVFATEMDAVMARDVLSDEGVRAFVSKDDSGGIEPHLQRTNGVSLKVNAADVEHAYQILRTLISSWKTP
jgi:hypothetical protein